jgi:hypothetical protein
MNTSDYILYLLYLQGIPNAMQRCYLLNAAQCFQYLPFLGEVPMRLKYKILFGSNKTKMPKEQKILVTG